MESSLLPRHDVVGRSARAASLVGIGAGAGLLLWNGIRLALALSPVPWWAPIVAAAGMISADFASGLIHWTADTWGHVSMPVLGRRFLHPFRVHHVNPDDFHRRGFVDTNGDVAVLAAAALVPALFLPLETATGAVTAVFVLFFCAVGIMTNQVHQWAHVPVPPPVVRTLQNWGILLSPRTHQRHHTPPYDAYYCIATGWCNRPLAAIGFFRRLERLITALTGRLPRQDDSVFIAEAHPAVVRGRHG